MTPLENLAWFPETFHYQYNGEDRSCPVGDIGSPATQDAVRALVEAEPPPEEGAHPVAKVLIGELHGVTFYVYCKSVVVFAQKWVERADAAH